MAKECQFEDNKYTRWYNNIILASIPRNLKNQYTERHHIIPKCLGGSNDKNNIAILTAREHFVCHLLLTKMVEQERYRVKLRYAAILLSTSKGMRIGSRIYESLRSNLKHTPEWIAKRAKSRTGIKYSAEARANISKGRLNGKQAEKVTCEHCGVTIDPGNYGKLHGDNCGKPQPPAWNKGKTMSWKGTTLPKTECPHCGKFADAGNYARWHGDNCKNKEVKSDKNVYARNQR